MIAFFTGTALGRNLAAIGALIIAGLAIAGALMRAGASKEKTKALRRDIKAHEVRNEVDRAVARSGDPKRGLRSKWLRGVEADHP